MTIKPDMTPFVPVHSTEPDERLVERIEALEARLNARDAAEKACVRVLLGAHTGRAASFNIDDDEETE